MIWVKLGILLIAFVYAGLLPYVVRKAMRHINFDLKAQTLSFLSNKSLYGRRYTRAYKGLLFAAALLTYLFFWLLSKYYDLGEYEAYMRYIDYSFTFLTLLAFIPHNLEPYSLKTPGPAFRRLAHNVLGGVVFLTLPILIILFQVAVVADHQFLGVTGLVVVGLVVTVTLIGIIKTGVSGVTEVLFVNGISLWAIIVTILTLVIY